MKKGLNIIVLVVISIAITFGCKKDKISGLPFTLYDNYFIYNTYVIDSNGSFLEFDNMASFNTVFGVTAAMSKNKYIGSADFDQNFVIAVLKDNGYNSFDMKITKIDLDTLDQQVINVDYEYNLIEANISWSQRGYSIAMLSKLDYHTTRFFENGTLVKELGN